MRSRVCRELCRELGLYSNILELVGLMFSELNIQVSEVKTQKSSMGTRSLEVSFERARWEVKADGLGEAMGSGIPEERWPYSPSGM